MDTSDVYPDPFGDALSYSSQRMAQLAATLRLAHRSSSLLAQMGCWC